MTLEEAIRNIALLGVMQPDDPAWLRHIMREYSKAFSTPLHVVYTLPLEDVLLNYFEDFYESAEDPIRQDHLQKLIETPEERLQRLTYEEAGVDDDDEFLKAATEEAAKEAGLTANQAVKPRVLQQAPEAKMPEPKDLPPDVMLKFDDPNLLEDWANSDPLGIPSPEKK